MGEHAALRGTRRTRRVDERRQVVGSDQVQAATDLLRRDLKAGGPQVLEGQPVGRTIVEQYDMLQCRTALTHLLDLRRLLCVLAEDQLRARVLEHVGALLRGVGVVDRRHHSAGTGCPAVRQCPLRRGQPEDRYPVPGLDSELDQPAGDLTGRRAELGVGDERCVTVAGELEGDPAPALSGINHEVSDRARSARAGSDWNDVHGFRLKVDFPIQSARYGGLRGRRIRRSSGVGAVNYRAACAAAIRTLRRKSRIARPFEASARLSAWIRLR